MINLQALKDIDDIDHLTLEKNENDVNKNTYHFVTERIAPERFHLQKAVALLGHIKMWYPETEETVRKTDLGNGDSVYNSLRKARDIILSSI